MKIKILSTLVIGSLLVAVAIGDTTSNGASLQTLVNQQRAKEEKNLETKKRPLETPEDFDVEKTLIQLNAYSAVKEGELSYEEQQEILEQIEEQEQQPTDQSEESNNSFSQQASSNKPSEPTNVEPDNPLVAGYNKYKSANNDTVGWIKIDGTKVDYPIMYSTDNSFYLSKTPYKEYSKAGSIFMDQQAGGKWGIMNLIHGHNMNNGSMFGDIANMMYEDYFNAHKIIQIYDGKTLKEYTAFAAFSLDDRKESIPIYYSTMEEYKAKIKDYQSRSRVAGTVPESANDFIILNTCWYGDSGTEKNSHAIIVAYRSK
jgi:sortase B